MIVVFPVWTGGWGCAIIEQSIIISILSRKSINIISLSIPDSISRNLNASDSENSREVLWKAETDRSENLLHSKYKGGSMGKTDIVTKNYMRGSDIFADAFNFLIYNGEARIQSQSLQERDATELAVLFSNDSVKNETEVQQKYRDVLKRAVIMQNKEATYLLLGIENQTDIHYAMPVRNMIYDSLQYGKQVMEIAAEHRKKKDRNGTQAEYLSGFYRDDRLVPVITLVIHFGAEEWDGPMCLKDMITVHDKKLLEYIQDYKIYLIDPAKLTEEDLRKFSTSLREVLGYIKYSRDKTKLRNYIVHNPRMKLEKEAAQVIKIITKTPIKIKTGGEKTDMCQAVDEMIEDGRREATVRILSGLVKDGILSMEEAASRAGMSVEELKIDIENTAEK